MILKVIKALAAKIDQFLPEGDRLVYTQLAPAVHSDMDFSEPPELKYIPNAIIRGVNVCYDWKGLVPDHSFRHLGVHKDDLVLFADVPVKGYQPRLNSFVVIPPLGHESINTGWGQLVQIKEVSKDFIVASAYVDAQEVTSTIPHSRIFALAVGIHSSKNLRRHTPSKISEFPALAH